MRSDHDKHAPRQRSTGEQDFGDDVAMKMALGACRNPLVEPRKPW